MLLAIDAGNTNTVFAVYDGEERKGLWRAATDKNGPVGPKVSQLLPLVH